MKRFLPLLLTLALLLSLAAPALAFTVVVSNQALTVNGQTIDCERYNIDGSNYFKLRDIAYLLNGTGSQFDVGWDAARGVASITTHHPYTSPNGTELKVGEDNSDKAVVSSQTIMIDGVVRDDLAVYNIGGNNFFQLRQIGEALDFDVDYDIPTRTMLVTSRGEAAGAVEVKDFFRQAGYFTGVTERADFSYALPAVSGADTAYIREINGKVQEIYETYVLPSLSSMNAGEYPACFCVSYYHAERGGIHSLLLTADSDWGMNYYWCFNFNARGEKADNAAVLQAVGLTPETFLPLAYDYLKERTDLSAYFNDDSWKSYQDATLSSESLNAEVPMAILPNGNLCFIAQIHTPAGAEVYESAVEITPDHRLFASDIGATLLDRLLGTYLIRAPRTGADDFAEDLFIEIFTLGETLMMELTDYDSATGSVYSYSAADLFPVDPAALLRTDIDSLQVRLSQYSPDVFTGIYFDEGLTATLTVDENGLTIAGAGGGAMIAERCIDSELWPDDGLSDMINDKFDYDAVEAAGIAGVWTGAYRDERFVFHNLTLELASWGRLRMRDTAPGAIPRVMEGSYYIAAAGDDAAPAGSVIFQLASIGGYKQPYIGSTTLAPDSDGNLQVIEDVYADVRLTQVNPSLSTVELHRVPAVRFVTEATYTDLGEGERFNGDIDGNGTPDAISYTLLRDPDHPSDITGVTVTVNGKAFPLDCMYIYSADVCLMTPALSGTAYLYVDGTSDNDYHIISVIAIRPDCAWWVGDFNGGFDSTPTSPNAMRLNTRLWLLSTTHGLRTYCIGPGGMPEALEPFYRIETGPELTTKLDLDVWSVSDDGVLAEAVTLPAGSVLTFVRTNGRDFVDMLDRKGDAFRIWIDRDFDIAQSVNGHPIADCFDNLYLAG